MKLREIDHVPSDIQVIVQGTDLDALCDMFSVDEKGIITSITGVTKHVSEHARSLDEGNSRSALLDPSTDTHQLHFMLDEQAGKVEMLTAKLESAQQSLQEEIARGIEDAQIASLNNLLTKEKQRVKRH